MKNTTLTFSLLLFFLMMGLGILNAQTTYTIKEELSEVIIEGTSNIHDWEMTVEDLESQLKTSQTSENTIEFITFKVPVKSLKSGKSRMDKNTYEALKAEDHSTIKFSSTSIKECDGQLYAMGSLTIAGTTKSVKIPIELTKTNDKITLNTSYEINMLDYKVEPPTAMFGTIKTGEKVVVKFSLIY